MNIIEMARQAGFITDFGCRETASDELLTRFAALVRNATLEEAAKCSRECHPELGADPVVRKARDSAVAD